VLPVQLPLQRCIGGLQTTPLLELVAVSPPVPLAPVPEPPTSDDVDALPPFDDVGFEPPFDDAPAPPEPGPVGALLAPLPPLPEPGIPLEPFAQLAASAKLPAKSNAQEYAFTACLRRGEAYAGAASSDSQSPPKF
jgi:hypothetical protein